MRTLDSSSQYGPPVTNLRTIALRNFQGKSGDNKFYREGGRAPLEYAVTGPAWELKANAADMYNVQELVYTDELKQNEAKDLLHVPKEDDLGDVSLEFRLAFLKFQPRMRLIDLIK